MQPPLRDLLILAFCVLQVPVRSIADDRSGAQRFTVADSIALVRIVDPDPTQGQGSADGFRFSPDNKHFLVVTRKGNLETGYSEYELRVFDSDAVAKAAVDRTPVQPPQLWKRVASFATRSRESGIATPRWLDNSLIGFIGRNADGVGQVFTVDVQTGEIKQLTHHAGNIAEFDISARAHVVVFAAYEPPDWKDRNERGYVVSSNYVKELSIRDPQDAIQEVRYYAQDLNSGNSVRLDTPRSFLPQGIWVSPNGRFATLLISPKRIPAEWWTQYEPLRDRGQRLAGYGEPPLEEALSSDVYGRGATWLHEYALADLASGEVRALFNAPAGDVLAGPVAGALWAADSSRIIIKNTFLPLDGLQAAARHRRQVSPAAVEFDVATKEYDAIFDIVRSSGGNASRVQSITGDASTLVVETALATTAQVRRLEYKRRVKWVLAGEPKREQGRLRLVIDQGLNIPPEIAVVLDRSGRTRRVTDFNPVLRERPLGTVQPFKWSTNDGRDWSAGLLLPPNSKPQTSHPLVIQTYGFNPAEFLIDGPNGMTAVFAARALANRDIAVLQMPVDNSGKLGTEENSNQLKLIESVIDALAARGIIDRQRIGIAGFSRTGMYVHYAVAFAPPKYQFAAAVICDSIASGYISYVNSYGAEYPGMLHWERLIGAPFWKEDRQLWLERSPSFNVHRIEAPLRIVHLSTYPSDYWDTFTLLKRHNRPVEMVHLPEGTHQLTQPYALYSAQEGTVDWFDFWLNDREDVNESKTEQYARWRLLREQRNRLRNGAF